MSFLDGIFEKTADVLRQSARKQIFPVRISEETLNKVAGNLLDKEIRSLRIAMHEGWCQADAHVVHGVAEFDVSVPFEITRFELGKDGQILELRQKEKLETSAQGWRNRIVVAAVKTILSAFLRKNLLQWGLKNMDGVTVRDDTISVDLAATGATDALHAAAIEKIEETAPYLKNLFESGSGKLANLVAISGAECKEGELVVNLRYSG